MRSCFFAGKNDSFVEISSSWIVLCTLFSNEKKVIFVRQGVHMSKKQRSYDLIHHQQRLNDDFKMIELSLVRPPYVGMSSPKKALDLVPLKHSPRFCTKNRNQIHLHYSHLVRIFFSMQLPVCRIRSITNYTDVPDHGFLEIHFACLLACLAQY